MGFAPAGLPSLRRASVMHFSTAARTVMSVISSSESICCLDHTHSVSSSFINTVFANRTGAGPPAPVRIANPVSSQRCAIRAWHIYNTLQG